ncbi:MAG: FAD-dependent oxidoreductase, partial [Acidobacteriaceae bacterium]|nr:FAD-dependent oxidoreductase [Acidobacteriaceae bacterium]
ILAPQPAKGRFYYPRNGFGAISDAYLQSAQSAGARVHFETTLSGIETVDGKVEKVWVSNREGRCSLPAKQVLSTIPISALLRALYPEAPAAIQKAACSLQFRSMVLIYLVLETGQFTEFDAHYFPGRDIPITRLSEPKNYGLAQLPGATVLCAELPCQKGDRFWSLSDEKLGTLVSNALQAAGLEIRCPIRTVTVRRLPQAYPIYQRDYREHFDAIDQWLNGLNGIVTFGRQGLFAHDNTHHTLAMAYGLNHCLDERGVLDRARWNGKREEFSHHVVED